MRDRSTQKPGSPTSWGRFVPSARHFHPTSPARSWPGSQGRAQCWVSPPIAYAVLGQLPNCVRGTVLRVVYRPQERPRPAGSSCVRNWDRERVAEGPQERPAYAVVAQDLGTCPNCGRTIVLRTLLWRRWRHTESSWGGFVALVRHSCPTRPPASGAAGLSTV